MSSDVIQFASNVERVEFSGRGLQRIMTEKGARYCLKIGHNLLAISKTGGCLLGESLADHLGVKGSGVVTFQHNGQYTIVSYGSNGVVASEYIAVPADDYYLLLAGECADKPTLWVSCDDDELFAINSEIPESIDVKKIAKGDIDSFFEKMAGAGAIKFTLHRPQREKGKLAPVLFFLGISAVLLSSWLIFMSGDDDVPVDPYAEYKREMSGVTLSSAINMAVNAVKSSLDIATWKVDNITVDANQTSIFFVPAMGEGVIKELSLWCRKNGYNYVISPEGVFVNMPRMAGPLDSSKIQGDIKGSVELIYDALNKLSMFKTSISPTVSKGNFSLIPVVFSGDGMVIEEVDDLASLVAKFPIRVEAVKLKSTATEYVFDVSIAATAIGE